MERATTNTSAKISSTSPEIPKFFEADAKRPIQRPVQASAWRGSRSAEPIVGVGETLGLSWLRGYAATIRRSVAGAVSSSSGNPDKRRDVGRRP